MLVKPPGPFIDTSYALALLNRHDQDHRKAISLISMVAQSKTWITEAVLIEIGDGMSRLDRGSASAFIPRSDDSPDTEVIPLDSDLIRRGLTLDRDRKDKGWGLTDCNSFLVMREQGLTDALTADEHFTQAGFRALMHEGT
jgi:predicted nucleic acid-binding protein